MEKCAKGFMGWLTDYISDDEIVSTWGLRFTNQHCCSQLRTTANQKYVTVIN